MDALSRREFLLSLAAAGAAGLAGAVVPRWALAQSAQAPTPLIVRSDYPPQYESPLDALARGWFTANDDFFVRCHLPVPTIDAEAYRLEVSGLVRTPLSLGLSELRSRAFDEATCVLECAGNGRALYDLPSTSGTQWEYGAVGNAAWKGVSLKSLLEKAELLPEARHVWFEAADRAPLPQTPPFLRSIPIEKAMDDGLLALAMNGAPLPSIHGGPLRAVVPGWYGMAWTKWVTRVRVEAAPSDNHFMVKGYHYVYPGEDPALAQPVEEIQVKSLITGFSVARVIGVAWAGPAALRKVEISTDGGRTWALAELGANQQPFSWRSWSAPLPPDLGMKKVLSRATDRAGRRQPTRARPNASGYANNSIVGTSRVSR